MKRTVTICQCNRVRPRRTVGLAVALGVCVYAATLLAHVAGLAPPSKAEASHDPIDVVGLCFSGVPDDPEWQISDHQEIADLAQFFQSVPPASPDPDWPQFGWRGFMIVNNDPDETPPLVTVFQGVIQVGPNFYVDQEGLEGWLSGKMPASLDPDGDGNPCETAFPLTGVNAYWSAFLGLLSVTLGLIAAKRMRKRRVETSA